MQATSKSYCFSLILVFLTHSIWGQGWEKKFDLNEGAVGYDLVLTDDGNIMITGKSSKGIDSLPVEFLLKTDLAGNQIWYKESTHFHDYGSYQAFFPASDSNLFLVSNDIDRAKVLEFDLDGNLIWSNVFASPLINNYGTYFLPTIDGNFIYIASAIDTFNINNLDIAATKFNQNGEILWSFQQYLEGFENSVHATNTLDSGVVIVGEVQGNVPPYYHGDINVLKLNSQGVLKWSKTIDGQNNVSVSKILAASDGSFFIVGSTWDDPINNQFPPADWLLIKIDSIGEILWEKTYSFPPIVHLYGGSVDITPDGGIILAGGSFSYYDCFLWKIDKNGNEIWFKNYGPSGYGFFHGVESSSNGYYGVGRTTVNAYTDSIRSAVYLVHTDTNGISYPNLIDGYVFSDQNQDCVFQSGESVNNHWLVELSGDTLEYFMTDINGYYQFRVDTGNYIIEAISFNPFIDDCFGPINVDMSTLYDTVLIDIGTDTLIYCPFLETDIATPLLRRCFNSTYYIEYCNNGTLSADTPFIEITLDTFLNFLNSSIPLTAQNGNVLTFDLDTIGIGECGQFTIEVEVDCDAPLGMTHCVEAHIYPDSLCLPTNGWSGGSVEVNGVCVNDTIHFSIKNDGNAPLSPGLEYIVIEDDVILYSGDIETLTAGAVQEVSIANVGATYRLETDQEPNHPGNSMPTFIIEGCGQGFTPGFVNQFPMDDADPFLDIDCRENIGSYDPNDKQAFPTGYEDEHFIEQNIDIEYLIRFQNTGTDTAFRVVIRDTLSNFLDVASVRPGASSHPYEFDISGPGILKFTFDNILLPDSTTNEPASNGFVKYKISQKENVPLGSIINNSAAIYFDFNAPIITNTTYHTVGEDFIPFNISDINYLDKNISVNVFPNPFNKKATIELNGINNFDEKTFLLFNSTGQLIQELIFINNKVEINGEELNNGVYYFKIKNEEGMLVTGKVVVVN